MKTIASTVSEYVKTKPYLASALSDGIINLTSLARKIHPDIVALMNKPVNQGAIIMSLKRVSDDARYTATKKIIKVLKNLGDITVRSALVDYGFLLSETLLLTQANLLKKIEFKKDVFYTSSRGVAESNIVVSQNIVPLVDELFQNEVCQSKVENLSSITIKLPTDNVKIPGIYYFLFQRLSWEGVNITEVISTSNEFTILMDEDQVDIAFKVIKDLMVVLTVQKSKQKPLSLFDRWLLQRDKPDAHQTFYGIKTLYSFCSCYKTDHKKSPHVCEGLMDTETGSV